MNEITVKAAIKAIKTGMKIDNLTGSEAKNCKECLDYVKHDDEGWITTWTALLIALSYLPSQKEAFDAVRDRAANFLGIK